MSDKDTQKSETEKSKGNSVKKTTNAILGLTLLTLVTCVVADRIIPSSDNVRVNGNVTSVTPQVSGQVAEVLVKANSQVSEGDVLVKVNPTEYQIAVKKAETEVKIAGQELGAQMADVLSAQAQLTRAMVERDNARRQGERMLTMAEKGIVSKADADKTRATIAQADAAVLSAKANLERAQNQVGADGEDNAQMQVALLKLQQAQLDLERTVLRAPSNGAVTNFHLTSGTYAQAGAPLMTFVGSDNLWLEANFRENSLGNIEPGDEVDIAFDFAPGEVFKGAVKSVDRGVSWGEQKQAGKLASVKTQNGWLRDTQRMPVSITLDDPKAMEYMRIGGQGDVIVYTDDNFVFDALGKAWIHLVSWFSYVR